VGIAWIHPSACPMPLAKNDVILAMVILSSDSLIEVEPERGQCVTVWTPEVSKSVMTPSLALLLKHSLGGYTIDECPLNCSWQGIYSYATR